MNTFIYSMVIASSSIGMAPQPEVWTVNYGDALDSARLAQRPLLVVLENPKDPEQRIESLHPGDGSKMGDLLLQYELCRVDVTSEYGKKVAEVYGAPRLPYTAITDRSARLILFRGAGKFSEEMWVQTLSFYLKDGHGSRLSRMQNRPTQPNKLFRHRSLKGALTAARQNRRSVLAFVTMDGCQFCERMKSETYADTEVRSMLSDDFESVVIQQTEEPDWVYDHGVRIFPTTILLNAEGDTVERIDGFVDAADFQDRLRSMGNRARGMISRR